MLITFIVRSTINDKPLLPWDAGRGTVYERKETMREILVEDSKTWPELFKRGEKKTTKVVRTYEKVQEYTYDIDKYDPDLVD
ncbi:hypothetical protein KIN20_011189 [Parelaphostrongylus tenuis]|uniref:Uncharacterized protein n=1 Tax=Parelaphostrongylus tenuis TaxID=148309 RepID=A0AAD5M912_PARTN|nr:hypothetical protein KIN20_011189 [Parelaphostrongylus tenuis]